MNTNESQMQLRMFTTSDWDAFAGCDDPHPWIDGNCSVSGVGAVCIVDGCSVAFISVTEETTYTWTREFESRETARGMACLFHRHVLTSDLSNAGFKLY